MSTHEFETKYQKYKDLLFRIAFTYVKSREDSEDILQEVFYKLLYKAPDFESDEHEKRWLIRITINMCKNYLGLYWNRNKTKLTDIEAWGMTVEEIKILDEVLALPGKFKAAVYLHYFEGYKCGEIAEILKIKESAVKMRLKKGRELLKIELEK
ncbi:MAG: RNA polymerase sigma factor [Eubacterium sp.]